MGTKNRFLLIVLGWGSLLHSTLSAKCTTAETLRPQVQLVPSPRVFHGEEPHWDPQTQSLYYVDIHANEDYDSSLLRYDYRKNRVFSASVDGARTLVFVLPIACTKDKFLVGIDKIVVIVKWEGKSSKATIDQRLFELDSKISDVIINDVKTDERGRFYGGTRILTEGKLCAGCIEPMLPFSAVVKSLSLIRGILMEIKLPAKHVTSLAFGGPNLDILYVTTASRDAKQPKGAGHLYKVTGLNARGYQGFRFCLDQSCMKQNED